MINETQCTRPYIFILLLGCAHSSLYPVTDVYLLKSGDQREVIQFLSRYLPPNPIIIDSGAFNGAETSIMASIMPAAKIYAFEPDPTNYQNLIDTVRSYSNVFCFALALSDKVGVAPFHRSEWAGVISQSGSLLAPKDHLNIWPSIQFNETINVQTTTLDAWAHEHNINHIDLLWLDMQGMELNVLKASPHILKTVKVIYTEVEFTEQYAGQALYEDVQTWLEQQGFILVAKNFEKPSKEAAFGDILMIRADCLCQTSLNF